MTKKAHEVLTGLIRNSRNNMYKDFPDESALYPCPKWQHGASPGKIETSWYVCISEMLKNIWNKKINKFCKVPIQIIFELPKT